MKIVSTVFAFLLVASLSNKALVTAIRARRLGEEDAIVKRGLATTVAPRPTDLPDSTNDGTTTHSNTNSDTTGTTDLPHSTTKDGKPTERCSPYTTNIFSNLKDPPEELTVCVETDIANPETCGELFLIHDENRTGELQCETTATIATTEMLKFYATVESMEATLNQTNEIQHAMIESLNQTNEMQQAMIESQQAMIESLQETNDMQQTMIESLQETNDMQQTMIESLQETNAWQRGIIISLQSATESFLDVIETRVGKRKASIAASEALAAMPSFFTQVSNFEELESAIMNATAENGYGPENLMLIIAECPEGEIYSFTNEIDATDTFFVLSSVLGSICILDGDGSNRLFRAGIASSRSDHKIIIRDLVLRNGKPPPESFDGQGGALSIFGTSTSAVELYDCTLEENTGIGLGGAVRQDRGNFKARGCHFHSNVEFATNQIFRPCEQGLSRGGACHLYNADASLVNCKFENNTAITGKGGAIYFRGDVNFYGLFSMSGTTFASNAAPSGQDIYFYVYESGSIDCGSSSNKFCDATLEGEGNVSTIYNDVDTFPFNCVGASNVCP